MIEKILDKLKQQEETTDVKVEKKMLNEMNVRYHLAKAFNLAVFKMKRKTLKMRAEYKRLKAAELLERSNKAKETYNSLQLELEGLNNG